jgi:hypothetical protein
LANRLKGVSKFNIKHIFNMGSKFAIKIVCWFISLKILLSCSTALENDFPTVYDIIVENKSGHTVRIEAYFQKIKYDNITIINNEQIVNHYREYGNNGKIRPFLADSLKQNWQNIFKNVIEILPYNNSPVTEYIHSSRDSVNIIFDEKKVIIQTCKVDLGSCPEIEKNVGFMINNTFSQRKSKTRWIKRENQSGPFVLTFTKEDYDRATQIVK